jgi:hypothetical protein
MKNYTEETLYRSTRTATYYKTPEEAEKSGLCVCGKDKPKSRIYCDDCESVKEKEREEWELKKFHQRPVKEWDKDVKMVYDENTELWFDDPGILKDHYNYDNINIKDARLIEGAPNCLQNIDYDYYDEIAEDFEFPPEFCEALDKLNEIASKTISHYIPGKYRIEI